jgi:hypothetical protein
MNIEHVGFLSWFPERRDARKHKNHAQDCETLRATMSRSQRPAILPWLSSLKWRPSFRWYGRFTRYRPAAGLLLDTPRRHLSLRVYKMHDLNRKTGRPLFRIMQIRAHKNARVNST